MMIDFSVWSDDSYPVFMNYLYSLRDLEYKKFYSRLILDKSYLIGVRTPILKDIAKKISRTDYLSFIACNQHLYYEEILLHGLLLGYLRVDFKELLRLLDEFMVYNTNWAINDIVCANMKVFKINREEGYGFIVQCLKSEEPFRIRFGLVLLLNYYIDDGYIDLVLMNCLKKYPKHYYVDMAIAWVLSVCYIKYKDKVLLILEKKDIDEWIFRKTISKICDSKRVSNEEKDYLRRLK